MKIKLFLQLIIFCFWANVSHAQTIPEAEARQWALDKGNMLLETFAEKNVSVRYKKLDNLFLSYVDLDYIGQFVVGKYWRQMTPAQKEEYRALFQRYALGIYKDFPLDFEDRISFDVVNIDTQEKFSEVTTVIALRDAPKNMNKVMVSFRLDKRTKVIKLTDIKLFESSLILSYRNRFLQMIANADEDITWFLEDLTDIVNSIEKNNELKLKNPNTIPTPPSVQVTYE